MRIMARLTPAALVFRVSTDHTVNGGEAMTLERCEERSRGHPQTP